MKENPMAKNEQPPKIDIFNLPMSQVSSIKYRNENRSEIEVIIEIPSEQIVDSVDGHIPFSHHIIYRKRISGWEVCIDVDINGIAFLGNCVATARGKAFWGLLEQEIFDRRSKAHDEQMAKNVATFTM